MAESVCAPQRNFCLRTVVPPLAVWLLLSAPASVLRAEPLDRQVAEWVILQGGSVRLEGLSERIREVTRVPLEVGREDVRTDQIDQL